MKKNQHPYQLVPFPKVRLPIVDSLHYAKRMPAVHALLDFDVTDARRFLREHRERTGESLSFTAFLTHCLARAVDESKAVHAYRRGSKLVIYDEVDVAVVVERELADARAPVFPHVVRAANRKAVQEIHQEIRGAQREESAAPQRERRIRQYALLPAVVRGLFWRVLLGSPYWRKRVTGTVGISAVGMFGRGAGWGIPVSAYTLSITVGGIAEKPGVVSGQVEVREYLSLTVSFDHEIVDGADAARFMARLRELVEGSHGLPSTSESADSNAENAQS